MRYLLPFLLLGATACQLPATSGLAPIQQGYDADYRGGWDTEPLRAAVWFDEFTGRASFDLSRSAHVAMFAMQPMGGIEMIYPSWGWGRDRGRAFSSGIHTVRAESRVYHLTSGRSLHDNIRSAGQTYIVLIASDRPLDLGHLLHSPTVPLIGGAAITWNPFIATRYLARQIVPGAGNAEWTAAYHVIWPMDNMQRSMRPITGRDPYTRVRCPGGQVVSVRIDVLRNGGFACPRPPADPANHPPRPGVTEGTPITRTLPNRPPPPDWRGATPTADADRRTPSARPVPPTRPVKRARPAAPVSPRDRPPTPKAGPGATVRPAPVGKQPTTRPEVRPRPTPRPAAIPERKPRPKPKPKSGGGGG